MESCITQLIGYATSSIKICNPYFCPGAPVLKALSIASSSGVKTQILLPRFPTPRMGRNLNQLSYSELLNYGVDVHEYHGFNHEKFIIIDEEIILFGTVNLNHRSLFMNREQCLLIQAKGTASKLVNIFEQKIANSHKIKSQEYKKRKNSFKTIMKNLIVKLIKHMA